MVDMNSKVTRLAIGHDAAILSMQDRVDQVLDFMENSCLVRAAPMDAIKREAQTASIR